MKLLSYFVALMFLSPAYTQDVSYKIVDSLVIQALSQAFNAPSGGKWEYGGYIYWLAGEFYIHAPETDKKRDTVFITYEPAAGLIVALYHTHPCYPYSYVVHQFSATDKLSAVEMMITDYMLDACTGEVHKFSPFQPELYDNRGRVDIEKMSKLAGSIVGNIGQHEAAQESPETSTAN